MEIAGAINTYLVPSMLVSVPILIVTEIIKIILKKKINIIQLALEYIFIVYIIAVMFLTTNMTLFTEGIPQYFMTPNLIPLVDTFNSINHGGAQMIEQIIYNVAMLLPFGFLLPLVIKIEWSGLKVFVVSVVFVVFIEILEYFSGRYADIDDLIFNCIGAMLGYLIYKTVMHFSKRHQRQ